MFAVHFTSWWLDKLSAAASFCLCEISFCSTMPA